MPIININIKEKIAKGNKDQFIVCDNSDYEILFDFDEEWEKYSNKTAIVTLSNRDFTTILFSGNKCKLPPFPNVTFCKIGVTASIENADETLTISTTTPASINCLESAKDENGNILPPSDDIYAQILAKLNEINLEQEPYNDLPLMNGTANAGSRKEYARGDHIHPSDNTKLDKITPDGNFAYVYAQTATGKETKIKYQTSLGINSSTIPIYRLRTEYPAWGTTEYTPTLISGMPENDYEVTPKKFVEDKLDGKVDRKINNGSIVRVYTERKGATLLWDASASPVGSLIPLYGFETSGTSLDENCNGYLISNTPKNIYHCANKAYVDAQKVYTHLITMSDGYVDHYIRAITKSVTPITTFAELEELANSKRIMSWAINDTGSSQLILEIISANYYTSEIDGDKILSIIGIGRNFDNEADITIRLTEQAYLNYPINDTVID